MDYTHSNGAPGLMTQACRILTGNILDSEEVRTNYKVIFFIFVRLN